MPIELSQFQQQQNKISASAMNEKTGQQTKGPEMLIQAPG